MRSSHKILLFIIPAAILITRCASDYNPFTDLSNARALLYGSTFADFDTIGIFGDDSVMVSLSVCNLIDSFWVETPKNRFFQDTAIEVTDGTNPADIPFKISYYDTGQMTITVTTLRKGGDRVTDDMSIFVKSQLSQKKLTGSFGSEFVLETPGVESRDVRYHWDFGRNVVISSPDSVVRAVINDAGISDTGWLRVSNLDRSVNSPAVPFGFSLNDETGPSILCINEGYTGRDTLPAGENFTLVLRITDRGDETRIVTADIDGGSFDLVSPPVYTALITGMENESGCRAVAVTAQDEAMPPNVTEKTFWLYFSSSVWGSGIQLNLLAPPADSIVFSSRNVNIYGSVSNFTGTTADIFVNVSVNGNQQNEPAEISSTPGTTEWSFGITLDQGVNFVFIWAENSDGDTISDTGLALVYNQAGKDVVPPSISGVNVDGSYLKNVYTPLETVTVKAIVFDAGSGVRSVELNGFAMHESEEGTGYVWETELNPLHLLSGTRLKITAEDKSGLETTFDSTRVYRNSRPEASIPPEPPSQIFTNAKYTDRILAGDDDFDTVRILLSSGPDGLTVDYRGNISWIPQDDDTGWNIIKINLFDGYQDIDYSYQVLVKDTSDESVPVFITTEQDFGSFIEAGDILEVELGARDDRGTLPFTYYASAPAGVTGPEIDGSTFTWAPQIQDTGYHPLIVSVSDALGLGDTLTPIILVIGPNRPCSLSVSHNLAVRQDSSLDISQSLVPDTLHFRIHDSDNPDAEQYTISAASQALSTVSELGVSKDFFVIIDRTWLSGGIYPIEVTVTDRRGSSFTLELELYAGN